MGPRSVPQGGLSHRGQAPPCCSWQPVASVAAAGGERVAWGEQSGAAVLKRRVAGVRFCVKIQGGILPALRGIWPGAEAHRNVTGLFTHQRALKGRG